MEDEMKKVNPFFSSPTTQEDFLDRPGAYLENQDVLLSDCQACDGDWICARHSETGVGHAR